MPKFADKITFTSSDKRNLIDIKHVSLFNDGTNQAGYHTATTEQVSAQLKTSFIMDIPKDIEAVTNDSGDAKFQSDAHGFGDGDEVFYGSLAGTANGTYLISDAETDYFKLMNPVGNVILTHATVSSDSVMFVGDHPDTRTNINASELRDFMQENVATSSAADDITQGDAAVVIETDTGGMTFGVPTGNPFLFQLDGENWITFYTGVMGPDDDNQIDLGTDSLRFKDGYFRGNVDVDGTLEADVITVGGTALNTVIAGVTVDDATTSAATTQVTNTTITSLANLITVGPLVNGSIATGFGSIYTTNAITSEAAVKGLTLEIASISLDETDITKLDSITNGTVAANKCLVVGETRQLTNMGAIDATGTIASTTTIRAGSSANVSDLTENGLHCFKEGATISSGINTASGAMTDNVFINNLIIRGNADPDLAIGAPQFEIWNRNMAAKKFSVDGETGDTVTAGSITALDYAITDTGSFAVDSEGDLVCRDINITGDFSLDGTVTVVNGTDVSTTSSSFTLDSDGSSPATGSGATLEVETGATEVLNPSLKWSNADTMGLGWSLNTHGAAGEEATNAEDRHIMTASLYAGVPNASAGDEEGTEGVPYNLSTGMVVVDSSNRDIYMYFA